MSDYSTWVAQLLRRYSRVVDNSESPTPAMLTALNTLQLADAVLDNAELVTVAPHQPPQIAVIGPTQSGKSTLVNVLLDAQVAGISALAGFTVHAQGYATGCSEEALNNIHQVMHPLERTPAAQLVASELSSYALESVHTGPNATQAPAVVWDTPDFDSIDASTYTLAVLNTVALADMVVLMVSKDKYGDKSVWDILALIEPLGKPLTVCINKLDEHDEQTVKQAFLNRYDIQFPGKTAPPLVLIPFTRKESPDVPPSFPKPTLNILSATLRDSNEQINRHNYRQLGNQFIHAHQAQWFQPLMEEQDARQQWQLLVDTMTVNADKQYAEEYLENDDKYDTFNRALAELLTLLEIPGIAPTLAKARQLITWPARKILGVGKSAWNAQDSIQLGKSDAPKDQESDTLEHVINSALISLQGELLEQPQNPFWTQLNQQFRKNEHTIRAAFKEQSLIAQKDFEPQIEEAAQKLFEQLQSQPALLNTLRAARVTADAAGVALALKSGGLAPADLILAPAMLSVTTLLTESALGRYLEGVKDELKQRQRAHMYNSVIKGVLAAELSTLPDQLNQHQLLAQHLEPELGAALLSFSKNDS